MEKKLISFIEKQAEQAEDLSFCMGIKLLHIRNKVEELLDFIGRNSIFEEYTLHGIEHIDEMMKIAEWLIPKETKQIMTKAEWLMLTLAIYFHDLGMVVTKKEYENREKSIFNEYKYHVLHGESESEYVEFVNERGDKFLYQEFVRENHAKRIRNWIENNENVDFGETQIIRNEINTLLMNLDKMFRNDLAMICESHHEDDIDDFTKYKVDVSYGNTIDEVVNLNYIAIILRIADLLHITRDRTPSLSRRIINVTNPISVMEWEKQQAVRAIKPKAKRNAEGNIDEELVKDTIEITAYFDGAETAEAYFGLSAYLQYSKSEIVKCNNIILKAQKVEGTTKYLFPWCEIDETNVTAVGFETKKLSFTLAQENILQLLVGHTLYNDSSVVVRELVQNAIDAVKMQRFIEKANHKPLTEGKIKVIWNENLRELSFMDNGTGMTIHDVENFLLKVGASKYRDESIKNKYPDFHSISHFGIGILTCFMLANDIEITTCSEEEEEANQINLRRVNGSYLLKRLNKRDIESYIRLHGTVIKLHVRNDIDMSELENDLKKWIVLPEIPVYLQEESKEEKRIGFNKLKDILIEYLEEEGMSVDGEHYDVQEKTHGNVTLAYAIRHLKYLSDWCLIGVDRKRFRKKFSSIGTCVEGIRVEFATPGYNNFSILAIANIKNSKYQTNVARSAIELDANKEILTDIYNTYAQYINDQMNILIEKEYSASWAISEGCYLMTPLIYSHSYENSRIEAKDEEKLVECFSKLNCLIIEDCGIRKVVSAEEVLGYEEVNIFESKMISAAEELLKEIKTDATLNNLVSAVSLEKSFIDNVRNVLCNYDAYNILHKYSLKIKK